MVSCLHWTKLGLYVLSGFGYALQGTLWGNHNITIKSFAFEAHHGICSYWRDHYNCGSDSYMAICNHSLLCPVHLLHVTYFSNLNPCQTWGVLAFCYSEVEELPIFVCCFSCLWYLDPNDGFLHEKKPIHSSYWAHSLKKEYVTQKYTNLSFLKTKAKILPPINKGIVHNLLFKLKPDE